jgi:predicted nucleic acid-binding protein
MMENRVFLDSAYAIALASSADQHHPKALELSAHVSSQRVRLLITREVCFEIANALSKARFRRVAVEFLDALDRSFTYETITTYRQNPA